MQSKWLEDKAKALRELQLDSDGNMMRSFRPAVCLLLEEQKFDFTTNLVKFAFYVKASTTLLYRAINKIRIFSLTAKCKENETHSYKNMLK